MLLEEYKLENKETVKVFDDFLPNTIESKQFLIEQIEKLLNHSNIDVHSNKKNHYAIVFGPIEYSYYKVTHKIKPMLNWMKKLCQLASIEAGYSKNYFNQILINKFIGTGIGIHTDDEPIYKDINNKYGAVGILSIGETKENHTFSSNRNNIELKLKAKDMSYIVMSSGIIYHKVGKAKNIRYSLTFRHVPKNQL